jgi:iron complex transport system substrate-binding protein
MKRHSLLAIVVALLVATLPAHAQTRSITDDADRVVEIPVDPQRIVGLRGESITTPLIELGANLVGADGNVSEGVYGGNPYVRGAVDVLDFRFEGSGITWVGSPNAFDIEAIAALSPDLILITQNQTDSLENLSKLAPTVVVDTSGTRRPLLERYRFVADVSNRLDVFEARLALWNDRVARFRQQLEAAIGDPAEISVVVADAADGTMTVFRHYDAMTEVLYALGFDQPALVKTIEGAHFIELSAERVQEIDADFMISNYDARSTQTIIARRAEFETMLPGWQQFLHAARNNQHIFIHRDEMRGTSFRSLRYALDVVMTNIGGRTFVPLAD